jgi:hypothetical protein
MNIVSPFIQDVIYIVDKWSFVKSCVSAVYRDMRFVLVFQYKYTLSEILITLGAFSQLGVAPSTQTRCSL